jgi:hypothetical protein
MAIRLSLLGSISDTPRNLTYTSAGTPRFSFGIRVGTVRKRHYLVVAYAAAARFADLFLRTGQRVRIEGAYLRRQTPYEGLIRADTIRHVGTSLPPFTGTMVSFVPKVPPVTAPPSDVRPVPHTHAEGPTTSALDEAIAHAMT